MLPSMDCSRLSVRRFLCGHLAASSSSVALEMDHLSPPAIFYSLIECRTLISCEMAAEEAAVDDSPER